MAMTGIERNEAIRAAKKRRLLEGLEACGIIKLACKQIGISTVTYYNWRDADEEFADAADEALQGANASVVAEVRRRAMGYEVPVMYKGEPVFKRNPDGSLMLGDDFNPIPLTQLAYSDRLLERLVEVSDPRFRTKGNMIALTADQLPKKVEIEFVTPEGFSADDYDEEGNLKK